MMSIHVEYLKSIWFKINSLIKNHINFNKAYIVCKQYILGVLNYVITYCTKARNKS